MSLDCLQSSSLLLQIIKLLFVSQRNASSHKRGKERQQSSRSKIRKHTLKKFTCFLNFLCQIEKNFKDYAKVQTALVLCDIIGK